MGVRPSRFFYLFDFNASYLSFFLFFRLNRKYIVINTSVVYQIYGTFVISFISSLPVEL